MPVVKINSLKLSDIKELLRERGLDSEGQKTELVLRLSESVGADVVEVANVNVQDQINELRDMVSSVLQLMQINENIRGSTDAGTSNAQAEQIRLESPSGGSSNNAGRNSYSVKEISETIPEFDPTNEMSITVEQFVDRVNSASNAYQWEEKCLLLAVYSRLKGAAKLWLNSSDKLYSSWRELSRCLCEEFSCAPDEADIHYKMCQAVRNVNENFLDYCFRLSALGKRFGLSESAIVKYARDGLKHRELQIAIAATRFNTMREFRQTIINYTNNIPVRANKYEKTIGNESEKNDKGKQIICYNCQEKGHISSKCTQPQRRRRCVDCGKVHPKNEPENCGKKKTVVRKTNTHREATTSNNIFEQSVLVNGKQLIAFIDTGSECSMIKQTIASELECRKEKCALKISGFCGGVVYSHAKIRIQLQLENLKRFVYLYVVDDELLTADLLLGQDIFNDMRAVIVDGRISFASKNKFNIDDIKCGINDNREKNELIELLNNYGDIFATNMNEIGETDFVAMSIELDTDVPIVQKPFRVPEPKKQIIADMINELLTCDIISKSSSEYASPMILVKKKNGSERLCVDFRRLNQHMRKEIFPMPNVEEQLQSAKQYVYFTVLDLNSGYYQIPIAEDSRKYTAFVTTEGLYEFKRMPFGLKNAPAVFQRLLAKIKERVKSGDMMNYMDDILIGSQSINEMYAKLNRVLGALRDANVTLNIQKCEFMKTTVEFLGHEITPDGIAPGVAKTMSIRDYKTPTNVTEIRQFLGLSGYFRKFVPGYALIAAPLNRLLRKDQKFAWADEQERAFNELRKILASRPVMTAFRVEAEHQVHTDASSIGLAGVLLQKEIDDWKPVIFYSRATTDAEKKYHSYELETLAVVESIERFRYYIYGKRFKVITDCSALKTTMNKRELVPRIARWWLRIQDYDLEIEHRSGQRMIHVDALSRAPVEASREIETASLRTDKVQIAEEDWLFGMQLQDEHIRKLVEEIKQGDKATMKNFNIRNGRLYKEVNGRSVWVVPKALRWQVVHNAHDKAGHLGLEKTLQRISEQMWFARMRNFVKSYLKSCIECTYNKAPGGRKEGELHVGEVEPIPFRTVHVDHLGPFPKSSKRNEHILVIIDAFTRFVIIRAVKSTATKHVIEVFNDVSSFIGMPERIISDRGTAYTSKEFEQFCNQNIIKHIRNAVRTPRANGLVERCNRTILSMLLPTVNNDKRWDESLRLIQWTINSMRNKTTSRTPQELLFGFKPRDISQNKIVLALQHDDTTNETFNELNVNELRAEATKRLKEERLKAKQRFDQTHAAPTKYNVNDLVVVEYEAPSTGSSRKLEPRYKGPFQITRALGNDRYVVRDIPGSRRTQRQYSSVYASDKIKLWCALPQMYDDNDSSELDDGDDPSAAERGRSEISGLAEL